MTRQNGFNFRPRSYFVTDSETAVLSRIKGALRREAVRNLGPANVDFPMAAESLSEEERQAVGRVHPSLMGGEYLPDLEAGEVEIARFELESVTADVISLRAGREDGKIRYRLVDEYDTQYQIVPASSDKPLTFGELIEMINGVKTEADLSSGSWPRSLRECNYEASGEVESLESFVHVSSEFYPQLAGYYEAEAAEWVAEKIAEKEAYERSCPTEKGTDLGSVLPSNKGNPMTQDKAPEGDVAAQEQCDLGRQYYYQGDYEKARQWLEKSAAQRFAPAQASLAYLYCRGKGVPIDYAKARLLWEEAAAQGLAKAQYNIGTLYAGGQGVPQNYTTAREWYEQAAAQGYPFAQAALGLLYAKGRGVLQDYSKAKVLWEQAAGQGSVDAQVNLGKMYAGAIGVDQDLLMARAWWRLAAAQGDKDAQAYIKWLDENVEVVHEN